MRKNKIYYNLHITLSQLPMDKKATATMKLEVYRQSFINVINALVHINETLALWPFEDANAPESDLLKNLQALGSLINQILKFFDSFCISKTFLLSYVNCMLGFNMDLDAFMQRASVMLADIPAKIFKWMLQVPHITCLGWILGTQEDFELKDFEQLLQDVATQLAPHQHPLVQYGLNVKPIWDGLSCTEHEKDKLLGYSYGCNCGNCPDFNGFAEVSTCLLVDPITHQSSTSTSPDPAKKDSK